MAAPVPRSPGGREVSLTGRLIAWRVHLLVFAVNLAGGLLMYLFLTVIDVSSLSRMRFVKSWETLAISFIPAAAGVLIAHLYSRSIMEYLRVVKRPGMSPLEESVGGGRIIHLRRKALRFPMVCAGGSLFGWAILGVAIAYGVWNALHAQATINATSYMSSPGSGDILAEQILNKGSSMKMYWTFIVQSAKGVGLAALLGGMISAAIFFAVEQVWERELPGFFPTGKITAVDDSMIVPVKYRLIVIFGLVGTVPLILIGVLSYQRAAELAFKPPEEVLGNLLLFNLFLVATGVGLAGLLAMYVARSVSGPLGRVKGGMEKVRSGNLSVQIPVRANDEFGLVTEGFNSMARALREKEESIQEFSRGLERKVEERTRELKEALIEKDEARAKLIQSEKMAGLGQLVAGVAHEINNPVGYIYANTDHFEKYLAVLQKAHREGDEESFARALSNMDKLVASTREGAKRTKDIVMGLSAFSRKDKGPGKPIEVREPIETALMLLGHELKKGIELKREYSETPRVMANSGELAQVFMNLFVNAIQAMGDSGELAVATGVQDGGVVVSISDTGRGMSEEEMARAFEPFFTTKEVGKGTGLGMSIAYGIVKSHGGELKVSSKPGEGTRVEVSLPPLQETDGRGGR